MSQGGASCLACKLPWDQVAVVLGNADQHLQARNKGSTDWLSGEKPSMSSILNGFLYIGIKSVAFSRVTSSPGLKNFLPQLCATRLIPAVAFAVKTTSRELRALMKLAVFALASSYAVVACKVQEQLWHHSLANCFPI